MSRIIAEGDSLAIFEGKEYDIDDIRSYHSRYRVRVRVSPRHAEVEERLARRIMRDGSLTFYGGHPVINLDTEGARNSS